MQRCFTFKGPQNHALNIMHTVYNLRHNVAVITITFVHIFQKICFDDVKPSLLRVPDGLGELESFAWGRF